MKPVLPKAARRSLGRMLQVVTLNGGGSPLAFVRALRGLPAFVRDAAKYRGAQDGGSFALSLGGLFPVLGERYEGTGALGHYFHQDLWAARKIRAAHPAKHLDIGSRVDGFVAHLLVFMPVTVIDVRPMKSTVEGLSFVQEDATSLRAFADDSVESISTLHAVEHFGLGRYGDPIDPRGPFKMMKALARVLQPGGRLYFAVPVGRERLEFNAQRVFAPRTIVDGLAPLRLVSFAAVDDAGALRDPSTIEEIEGAHYACGLFELTKD
jgi:SAM-dependent methyltransferase